MAAGTITTVVVVDEDVDLRSIETAFPVGSPVQVAGVVEGIDGSWSTVQETPADVLVVACASYSERALYLIDGAVKQRPDRPVVVLYRGEPDGFMRRAFEVGADDLITLPREPGEIGFAIEKVLARRRGATVTTDLRPMICVLGPKGGTGKTLTSCNLAVALALAGKRPVLVDLDLQFGDVGIALGLAPDRTIFDLARSGGTLDGDKIDDYLVEHPSGVRALLGPSRPDQASAIHIDFLRDVYTTLRSRHDFVIVDTAPGFTPEVIASIDSASDLCVVGTLDALSLKDTKLGLETLQLMGYDADNLRLVLNRADSNVGINLDDVIRVLGRQPDVFVPSDREIPRAVTEGRPIVATAERSAAARAFKRLASLYLGEPGDGPPRAEAVGATANSNGRQSVLLRLLRKGD
jgi:pilus assembly protein CpaE